MKMEARDYEYFKQKTVSVYWMEKEVHGYKTANRENIMKTIAIIKKRNINATSGIFLNSAY